MPIDDNGSPYRVFDPCIWKEDDGYYSLSGTYRDGTIADDCRAVDHVFRSRDLETWERLGPLIEGTPNTELGEDGAVPNFLPIGRGKHMLLFFSHKRGGQYYVDDYDHATHRFTPDYHGRMNYGPLSVAASTHPRRPGTLHRLFQRQRGQGQIGLERRANSAQTPDAGGGRLNAHGARRGDRRPAVGQRELGADGHRGQQRGRHPGGLRQGHGDRGRLRSRATRERSA